MRYVIKLPMSAVGRLPPHALHNGTLTIDPNRSKSFLPKRFPYADSASMLSIKLRNPGLHITLLFFLQNS
jgi:hypothetical protein